MDVDKKATDIEDRTSVLVGHVDQDAAGKVRPESLAHLSDDEMAARSRQLTRKMDLFSEQLAHCFPNSMPFPPPPPPIYDVWCWCCCCC